MRYKYFTNMKKSANQKGPGDAGQTQHNGGGTKWKSRTVGHLQAKIKQQLNQILLKEKGI